MFKTHKAMLVLVSFALAAQYYIHAIPRRWTNSESALKATEAILQIQLIDPQSPEKLAERKSDLTAWHDEIKKDLWLIRPVDNAVEIIIATILGLHKGDQLDKAADVIKEQKKRLSGQMQVFQEEHTKIAQAHATAKMGGFVVGNSAGYAADLIQKYILPVVEYAEQKIVQKIALDQALKNIFTPDLTYPAPHDGILQLWKKNLHTWEELLGREELEREASELAGYLLELKKGNKRNHYAKKIGHYVHALRKEIKLISKKPNSSIYDHKLHIAELMHTYILPLAEKAERQLSARASSE